MSDAEDLLPQTELVRETATCREHKVILVCLCVLCAGW